MATSTAMITKLHHELAGPSATFALVTTLISIVAVIAVVVYAIRMQRT